MECRDAQFTLWFAGRAVQKTARAEVDIAAAGKRTAVQKRKPGENATATQKKESPVVHGQLLTIEARND